ncbi:MAG: valine--tRNA ligase, partial [Ginsengibacter sp.]
YGNIIYSQIRRLGCSVDWDRVTFTMDDHYYQAVIKIFVDLYNKGLVYRGARMINWDTAAQTALSDEEVEYKDVTGKLYFIKYKLAPLAISEIENDGNSEDNFVTIATQRPETIMGDVAICANPNDDRYTKLKGRKVIVPLINKEVPVIFDDYVEKDFGTGILKITPAHDIHDFNIGLKYHLPVIDTLNNDGTISEAGQIFVGEDRFTARKKIIAALKEKGLLIKEEEYPTRLGYSQRSQSIVEPKISTQWFVKMKDLATPALDEVTSDNIRIHPKDKFTATYKYWLENVKDWCISRQLWWGQQIPAWYDEEGKMYVAETEEEARKQQGAQSSEPSAMSSEQSAVINEQLAQGSKIKAQSSKLTRDEDVLDTWFSSWLWPIEVFKGISNPDNKEINYYYPTSVLVTGQDIIFFWVARMIMAGMEYMKEKPFADVYFTGMVRDKLGRKMSKSLGNSPDLLNLIDQYGADAVRFGIMISSPAGNDLLFDESSLEQGKFFNNKLWNALKLVKMWEGNISTSDIEQTTINEGNQFAQKWFENRLAAARMEVDLLMQQFKLSEALKIIYSLIWDDFCSWYLEWVKPEFGKTIAKEVFEKTIDYFDELLQLLHPFMPFITEEIYHLLKERTDDLTVKQFQEIPYLINVVLQSGSHLKELITAIRDARNKNNLKFKEAISICIETNDSTDFDQLMPILSRQVNADAITFGSKPINTTLTLVVGNDTIYIRTEKEIDTAEQLDRLHKDLQYLNGFLISIDKKLSNDKFVQNAKPEIIALEKKKKYDAEIKIETIRQSIDSLQ